MPYPEHAIFRETRNGVRPISGTKNQATAIAFGGPRSSCVRPGAHPALRQDSRKDLTPCRMALHFVSAGAHAPHSDETLGPMATRGSSHSARRLRSLAFLCSSCSCSCSCEHLPWAAITFDEFHAIQLINKATDEVRRQEAKRARSCGVHTTSGFKDKHAWSNRQKAPFAELKRRNLKTHRGFRIQEMLREIFHSAQSATQAELLPNRWYSWARRCRLELIKAVAKTLKKRWPSLLNAFDSSLTNGRVEAVNSLIQAAKARARGYRTTRHLIPILYLVAGKLTQPPTSPFVVQSGLPITA